MRLLFVVGLLCYTVVGHAQLEISAGTFVDRYQDELKPVYNPGHTYQLAIGLADREENTRFALSGNLGYGLYTPKAAMFYTVVGHDIVGYRSYGDYQVYQFTLAVRYDFLIWRCFEFYAGFEGGYHFTSYNYASFDGVTEERDRLRDARSVLIPLAGMGIQVYRFCFFAQTQYNFSSSDANRSRRDGLNRIWSNGVGLRFRLE